MLRITLFGHFCATLDGEALTFPTKSAMALTAYLLLEHRAAQPRAHIATLLWPDTLESKGRRNLRQTLLRLRQALPDAPDGQPPILAEDETLRWNPAYPVEVDVYRFEAEMARAEPYLHVPLDQTPYPAIAPLQAAVALYTADLLLGLDLLNDFYAEWLQPWRTKYHRQALTALARLAECYGRAGLLHRMEEMARRQLALDPEREIAHRQLMQAYLARGEHRAALRHYAAYEKDLEEYGNQPAPPLRLLQQRAKAYREQRVAPAEPIPHNLPPERTPFHGRQDDVDDLLMGLVAPDVRLLTLTGLGGIGKTRLALAAARPFTQRHAAIPPRFPGGVWFVPLAEVQDDDEETLAQTILTACGGQASAGESALQAVIRHLRGEACLLILDNLEHLPGAPAFVARLLRELPHLNVLATSRHPLGLQQEVARHLQGLPVPADAGDTEAPSMTLLRERLQRVDSDFRLTSETAPALVRICRALEGWPLALELAAGWGDRLPVSAIAERVADNLDALRTTMPDVAPRHRSIKAALTGSYALLTPTQRRILAGFAIFHGGCTIEGAQTILNASLEDLTLLVRRALLRQQGGRYTIHELIRQFAAHELEASGEQAEVAGAHAQYYLHLLASLEGDLYGPHPLPAARQLRLEWENLRAAWHWAIEHAQHGLLAAALPALLRFIFLSGLLREGKALIEAALPALQPPLVADFLLAHARLCIRLAAYEPARASLEALPPLETLSPAQQIEAHTNWGMLLYMQGFPSQSREHYLQGLALARAVNDHHLLIESLAGLAEIDGQDKQYTTESAALLEMTEDVWLKRGLYSLLGSASIRRGDYPQARAYWQKALDIALELEDGHTAAVMYNNLGDALRELGEYEEAEIAFQKALEFSRIFHYEPVRQSSLEGWARLCVLRGDYDTAITLARQSIALARESGERMVEATALSCLGHAFAALGQWSQAEAAYRQSTTLLTEFPSLNLENLVGLAYIHWKQGNEAEARTWLNRFLDTLKHNEIIGFASPALSYARAAELLQALGEKDQAEALLSKSLPQ